MKDVGLSLNLILSQKAINAKQNSINPLASAYRKGICYAFNESQCKWNTSCKYRYECSYCAVTYKVIKCFKQTSTSSQTQSDIYSKSLHTSEAGKHASLV